MAISFLKPEVWSCALMEGSILEPRADCYLMVDLLVFNDMAKKLIPAFELARLIQDEITALHAHDGDCDNCKINSVYWHEPDERGSNWDVHSVRGAPACADVVLSIVARLKPLYNIEK